MRILCSSLCLLVLASAHAQSPTDAYNTPQLPDYSDHLGRIKAERYYQVEDGSIPKLQKLNSDPLQKYKEALLEHQALELKASNQVTSGFRLNGHFKDGQLVLEDVPQQKQTVTLSFPSTCKPEMVENFLVLFPFDKYYLTPKAQNQVDAAYAYLQANPGLTVNLAGHTDTMGTNAYNVTLSYNRVTTVANALMKKGVAESWLSASFHGEDVNVIKGGDQYREQANRRTEIQILKPRNCGASLP